MPVTPLCNWQDGVIPYEEDETERHSLKSVGITKDHSFKGLIQKDTRLKHVDVDKVNLLNRELNQTDAIEVELLEFKRRFSFLFLFFPQDRLLF